jgi:hypothetical protein
MARPLIHWQQPAYFIRLKWLRMLAAHLTCRWLGGISELCEAADSRGGVMSREQTKRFFARYPEIPVRNGITPSDLKHSHIDHWVPKCKQGLENPVNYVLMEPRMNQHFGGAFTLEKCQYVGLPLALHIIDRHILKLPRATTDTSVLEHCIDKIR